MHELVGGFANAVQLRQPCGRDRVGERGQVAANEDHIDAHSRVTDGVNLTLHEDPVRGVFCVWPEICHDQNIRFGISYFEGDELSIAFRRWTRETYLAFPEAARVLGGDPSQLVDTGAPIEPPPSPRPDRATAREHWAFPKTGGHVLLIYGGSQGSLAINSAVGEWLAARQRRVKAAANGESE